MTRSGSKTKILVAGIGGVGGYFGGLLARHYADDPETDIYFLARGEHLEQIKRNGLTVIKGGTRFTATPALANDDSNDIGTVNLILLCTKSYDLEATISQLKPCITADTVIIPLLNGVNSRDRINALLPDNFVTDGCAYIVSRLKAPGVIENSGNVETLFFGLDQVTDNRLLFFEKIMQEAGIQATCSNAISTIIWEKFIFISATATATSYHDQTIGELAADETKAKELINLLEEVRNLALAKNKQVTDAITQKLWNRITSLPYATTTSMHSDFKNSKPQTEVESLTGYVVREGKQLGIETPTFEGMYEALKSRTITR